MDVEDTQLRFIKNKRYAVLDDYAIVGDLHLGFEEKLNKEGYNIPVFSKNVEEEVLSLPTKKLILLGDVKEKILNIEPYDRFKIKEFFHKLSNKFEEVIITKGNHDGNIEKFVSDANIYIRNEFQYKNFLFLHGHRLPDKNDLKFADTMCVAHIHPSIKLIDKNGTGYREDCWLLCDFNLPENKFGKNRIKYLIVFPTFNQFIGGQSEYEENQRSPWFLRYIKQEHKLTINLTMI